MLTFLPCLFVDPSLDRFDHVWRRGRIRKVVAAPSTQGSKPYTGRKNYPGRRTDPGWKYGVDVLGTGKKVRCNYCAKVMSGGIYRFKHHLAGTGQDSESCTSVPDEVRDLMRNIVAETEEASKKKRKLLEIEDENEEEVQVAKPQIESKGKKVLSLVGKGKIGGGVQQTLKNYAKKDLKEQSYDDVAQYFYTSAIPFNAIKNPNFAKMLETIGRFGCGLKPPSYHDVREPLLKRVVT